MPLLPPQGEDSSSSASCSSVGSLPWETLLRELLQHGSFPQTAALHELLQHGSFPRVLSMGCSPSGTGCSSVGPHRATGPASKPAPRGHSLLRASPCSGVGPSPGCRWVSAPAWASMGCRGTACLTMGCSRGCRGTSALVPGAPPAPPSALTVGSAGLLLSHVPTPLSCCKCHYAGFFFPLLSYIIPEVLPSWLMGLALVSGGSILEPAGTGSIRHRGSFWQLLTEATPVAPLLPKPCCSNPVHLKNLSVWEIKTNWVYVPLQLHISKPILRFVSISTTNVRSKRRHKMHRGSN